MNLLSKLLLLFHPDNGLGNVGAIGSSSARSEKGGGTADDDLKTLREGETETEDEEETEESEGRKKENIEDDEEVEEEEEEDSTEEEEEEEEEGEEEEEEEEEEEVPGGLVSAKDLKAKYPDIFKKIPELRNVIYREQQYSQVFADPKEAQEAAGLAETFREMESDLVSGDSKPLISGIKKTEGANFDKFAAGFLSNLKEVDETAFLKVIAVPFKQMLRAAFAKGKKNNDKNLEYAAQHIHNYIFDDVEFSSKTDFEQPEAKTNPEEEKFKRKVEELDLRDRKTFKITVDNEWGAGVESAFLEGFDPKARPTKWVLDKMVQDCVQEVNKQLTTDSRHMKNMEVLWRQAKAAGYNAESKSRIVNAALARAKQLIPSVRTKIRSEAFAKGKTTNGESKKTKFKPSGSSASSNGRNESRNENKDKGRRSNPKSTESMSELDVIRG